MNEKLLKDALDFVDGWVDFIQRDMRLPGVSVAVGYKDKLLMDKAYGFANLEKATPLTPKHYFRIASHSKMFTATAVMLLVEQGKLQLDGKVSTHLTWFKSKVDPVVADITVRQLLSHSSGLIRDGVDGDYWLLETNFPDEAFLKDYIRAAKVVLQPNEKFKYSNFGYSYLGFLIEAVSGQAYAEFVKDRIIDKLGLKNTGPELDEAAKARLAVGYTDDILASARKAYAHPVTNGMVAATGFYSTAADMCRFARAHYLGNSELLTDASKREMQRLQWEIADDDEDYGLGLSLRDVGERKTIGHGGGFPGFVTNTLIDPKDQLVSVALTNSLDGAARGINVGIINIIDYFQREGTKKADKKHDLSHFAGRFFSNWGADEIVVVGNSIVTVNPGDWEPFESPTKLSYVSPNELRIEETNGYYSAGEIVSYEFNTDGSVKLINYASLKEYPWEEYKKRYID